MKHALGFCSLAPERDREVAARQLRDGACEPVPFFECTRVRGTYLDVLPSELLVWIDRSVQHHRIVRPYSMPDGTRHTTHDTRHTTHDTRHTYLNLMALCREQSGGGE
jgi:hypothetical protein